MLAIISTLVNTQHKIVSKTNRNSVYSLFNLLSQNILFSHRNFHYEDSNLELSISPLQHHINSTGQITFLFPHNNQNDVTNDSISIYTINNKLIHDERFLSHMIIIQAYRNGMKVNGTTLNIKSIRILFKISACSNMIPQCVSWKPVEGIQLFHPPTYLVFSLFFC